MDYCYVFWYKDIYLAKDNRERHLLMKLIAHWEKTELRLMHGLFCQLTRNRAELYCLQYKT